MAENTAIEWADHTFNPWTGCTKVSPACDHCYAESWAKRSGTVRWGHGEPRRRTTDANWRLPIKWNAQAQREGRRFRVFCASLADVFDNEVPVQWRVDLFRLIASTPHLDWLLLTKRIGNALPMMREVAQQCGGGEQPMPNVWLGATVVTQAEADRDVPKLLAVPARVRFLSIEPMLGPITLPGFNAITSWCPQCKSVVPDSMSHPHEVRHGPVNWRLPFDPTKNCSSVYDMLHWVICGGESGPHARPMHPDWARSLRDQCAAAGVPFLFKQWGEWAPAESVADDDERLLAERWIRADGSEPPRGAGVDFFGGDEVLYRAGKKAAGRLLDGRTHDEFPLTKLQAAEKEAREPSLFPPT